jgi:hypothetical protein
MPAKIAAAFGFLILAAGAISYLSGRALAWWHHG